MSTFLNIVVRASRPAGWIFGPILFGIGFLQTQYIPKTISTALLIFSQTLSFSFPLCIIVFGINDVYDYQSDMINSRKLKAGLEGGVLTPDHHDSVRNTAYCSTVLILLISILTFKCKNVLSTLLLLTVGWQYSAPPIRLKEVPFVDSLSNGLIVFSAWCAGYSYREGNLRLLQSKGLVLALCSSGVHALGAAVDYPWDMDAGQTTIATYSGQTTACFFGFLLFLIGWYLERDGNRLFRFYLQIGSLIMALSCPYIQWLHFSFKILVWWTILMVLVWFFSKVRISSRPP